VILSMLQTSAVPSKKYAICRCVAGYNGSLSRAFGSDMEKLREDVGLREFSMCGDLIVDRSKSGGISGSVGGSSDPGFTARLNCGSMLSFNNGGMYVVGTIHFVFSFSTMGHV